MVHSRFFHFFPIPSFLHMPATGVSISDDAIRYMSFATASGLLKLDAYGEKALPDGAVIAGHIANVEQVAKALAEIKQEGGIKFVRMTVPDEKVYIFKTSLPPVSKAEARSALEFKLEEHVPITVAEAVFDYKIENHPASDGSLEVVVGAIAESEASLYAEAAKKAGLLPLSLEIESQAAAIALVPQSETGLVLIVNLEVHKTGMYLVKDGVVHFTTTIPMEDLPAMAPAPRGAAPDKLHQPKYRRLHLVRDEIEKLSNFWREHGGDSAELHIGKVILCGTDSADAELVEFFAGMIKREVSVGNVWTNAQFAKHYVPELHQEESLKYTAAIGAALSEFSL